jgi:hypothetical protein
VSPNPVTGVAAWTVTVWVDVLALAAAALVLAWDHHCPIGAPQCPAPAQLARRDALVLAVLGGVLVLMALLALVRGRWLLLLAQVAVLVVVGLLASRAVPAGFSELRSHFPWTGSAAEFEFPR